MSSVDYMAAKCGCRLRIERTGLVKSAEVTEPCAVHAPVAHRDHIEELIERSSLGSAEAKAVRESVSPDVGRAIALASRYYGEARALRERIEALAADWERVAEQRLPHGGCFDMYRHLAVELRAAIEAKS